LPANGSESVALTSFALSWQSAVYTSAGTGSPTGLGRAAAAPPGSVSVAPATTMPARHRVARGAIHHDVRRPMQRRTGSRSVDDPVGDRGIERWTVELRQRLDELIDGYRAALHDSLSGLTEDEARRRLVPSKTTLLGLLKHVTYVEGIWFEQAVSGRTTTDIGIPSTPDRSFTVTKRDTIESVQAAHRRRCELSRRTMDALALDDVVDGRGARPVWALQLQVLRELAQHAGHADILREQILAARSG
jgi:hypothetical protein